MIKMHIGQFLEDTRAFARLKVLMEHAGLLSALKQPGRFTLFAARNEAFGTDDEWEAILNDPVKLKELAEYHLIECEALSTKEIRGLRSLLMANDKQVWVHADPRLWLRDQADGRIEIWQPDLTFANGVVHIVDNVLWPWREESKSAEAHACAAATSKIDLVTAYHVHPIELNVDGEARQIHRIYLRVKLTGTTGKGELQLDATSCVDVDFFGEPSNCSPGIYAPSTIELRQVYAADTTGKGRALFTISGAGIGGDALLVVPRDARDSYRLILGPSAEEGEAWRASHVLTLERDRATAR